MSVIEIHNLSFVRNNERVLDDVSLTIQAGEYVGIIGANGGGKTTLLRIILGLENAQKGAVKLFDHRLEDFHEWPRLGYLSQRAAQVDLRFPITVQEVVTQGRIGRAGLFHRLTQADHSIILEAMRTTDVYELRHRLMERLSGGERQRVLIARALASEPELLIFDEPLVGVDAASQKKFYAVVKRLNEEHKITVVFVSHDIHELAQQASRIVCINRKIVADGPPEIVYQEGVLEQIYGEEIHHFAHGSHAQEIDHHPTHSAGKEV